MTRLAGPLGAHVHYEAERGALPALVMIHDGGGDPFPAASRQGAANGSLLLRRACWVDVPKAEKETAKAALLAATAWSLDPIREPRPRLLDAVAARRAAAVDRLRRRGRTVRALRIRPAWRVVVGLGEETPAEIGMSTHPVYGVPMLPGSALKGAARACARVDFPESFAEYGRVVFGKEPGEPDQPGSTQRTAGEQRPGNNGGGDQPTPAGEGGDAAAGAGSWRYGDGRFVFLDALPDPPRRSAGAGVTIDVMNPHVAPYYQDGGKTPPAEYHQPIPVFFLTVTSEITFTVYVIRRGANDYPDVIAEVEDVPVSWVVTALEQWGLGAKTNAGYGYFTAEVVATGDGAGTNGGTTS